METVKGIIVNTIVLAVVYWLFIYESVTIHKPGIIIPYIPDQTNPSIKQPFKVDQFSYKVLADMKVEAKVLGVEKYRHDAFSEISPIDLALGWQKMSDQAVIDTIDISQSGRFYRWKMNKNAGIAPSEVTISSANFHIIPASEQVKNTLKDVLRGDIVSMTGHLVYVKNEQTGTQYRSSLTRSDSGPGACEVFYVTDMDIIQIAN